MSSTERLGTWWLADPSDGDTDYQPPERTVAGMLKTGEPLSWELTTIGKINPNDHFLVSQQADGLNEHRAIWGTDAHGKSLSLLDPYPTNYQIQFNNPFHGTEGWGFGWYVVGGGWVTPDDVIERLYVPFDGLDDWVIDSASSSSDYSPTDEEMRKFERPPRLSHATELNTAQVRLIADSAGSSSARGFSFNRFALFEIDDSIRLDQVFDKWIDSLSLFVSLVTGIPARLGTLQFELPESRWPLEFRYNIAQSRILHNQGLASFDYIAPLPRLVSAGLSFDSLLQAFFTLCEDEGNRAALRYLSESQSGIPDESTEAKLLSAFKAAEQCHTSNLDSQSLPSINHQRRVEAVVESAPTEHRRWARESLSNRNSKGLKTQLRELQELAGTTGAALGDACPRMQKEMATYRHRIAHSSAVTRNDFNVRCYLAAKALRWMLRHVYFAKLGLSQEAVTQIIQDSHRFQADIRLLEDWHHRLFKDQIVDGDG